jgi:hypothetical protein
MGEGQAQIFMLFFFLGGKNIHDKILRAPWVSVGILSKAGAARPH